MASEADQVIVQEPPGLTVPGLSIVVIDGAAQEESGGGGALQEASTIVPSLVMPQEFAIEVQEAGAGAGGAWVGNAGAGHVVPGCCAAEQVPLHRIVPYAI